MALQKPFNSPYSAVPVDTAYFRIVEANMNFVTSTGQITVSVYESQQARDLGKQPLGSIVLSLTKYGKPPTDAEGNILFKQLDGSYKNGAGDTVVPNYVGFPTFDQIIDSVVVENEHTPGTKVFDIAKGKLYQLLKTQPDFASAQDV